MYLSAIISLISAGALRRDADRRAAGRSFREPPKGLAMLNDRQLRDIGYLRERTVSPRRHLLWM